ncbi:MAG: dihydroorotase [Legionellales bacterium]|nr:dihydroorotase [Legionellales bacterium]
MKIKIQGARCVDPASQLDENIDVFISDDKIVALGSDSSFTPDQVIDAKGLTCFSGLVDTAARLREPGHTEKGSIESETAAARQRGVLHILCYPDTSPELDSTAIISQVIQAADTNAHAKVWPIGALTKSLAGTQLADFSAMQALGCPAVSNAQAPLYSDLVALQCYQYAANCQMPVIVRPQIPELYAGTCAHEGRVSTRLGLPSSPACAETIAVAKHLALAAHTNAPVHFACLSAGESVDMIAQAKTQGLKVTASVSAHQCHLTEMDVCDFNAQAHLVPPLRSERDKERLIKGLAEGVIDCICSDHQPHEATAKLAPYGDTAPGMSTIETFLSLVLYLVEQEKLSLTRAIEAMTNQPAQIFNLPTGRLQAGAVADLILVDTTARWEVSPQQMRSMGKNTAFNGWSLPGQVLYTLLAGQLSTPSPIKRR